MKRGTGVSKIFFFMITLILFCAQSIWAYTFTWDESTGTLTINVSDQNGETLEICVCSGGDVTVNGEWLKDGGGSFIHVAGNIVQKLVVNGGDGNDNINLSCITQGSYPGLAKTGEEFKIEVNGGAGVDIIMGSDHADLINGDDGNDVIDGQEGDDEINGGTGSDQLYGWDGNDTLNGGDDDDYIEGEGGGDTIHGGAGHDEIYGASYEDKYPEDDDDVLYGDDGNDIILGDAGADEIYGGAGNDIFDIDFNDSVTDGGSGNDRAFTKADAFALDMGATPKLITIFDSEGEDELDFSLSTRGIKLNMDLFGVSQAINNFGYNLQLDGEFENLRGTDFDDEITIKAMLGYCRGITCGLQVSADILNFDAENQPVVDDGYAISCEGVNLVMHSGFEIVNILNLPTDVSDEVKPLQFSLNQNYPNPFNPATTISYTLPERQNVVIKIYDSLGKEVAAYLYQQQDAGEHEFNFNAADLSSGVYYYKIEAGNYLDTKMMMLLK